MYDYKRVDFVGLRRALQLLPWHMLECMEVDAAVELFYDLVFAAVNDYVPMIELPPPPAEGRGRTRPSRARFKGGGPCPISSIPLSYISEHHNDLRVTPYKSYL